MAHLEPLPLEVFLKLKEEIDRTHINDDLIKQSKELLSNNLKEKGEKNYG